MLTRVFVINAYLNCLSQHRLTLWRIKQLEWGKPIRDGLHDVSTGQRILNGSFLERSINMHQQAQLSTPANAVKVTADSKSQTFGGRSMATKHFTSPRVCRKLFLFFA